MTGPASPVSSRGMVWRLQVRKGSQGMALCDKTARRITTKGYAFAAFTSMHGGVPMHEK